jgi:Asparagine synthase
MTSGGCYFYGRVGPKCCEGHAAIGATGSPTQSWSYANHDFVLSVSGRHARTASSWQASEHGSPISVLAAGSLYLGSDGDFGELTSVLPLSIEAAPKAIGSRFEIDGPSAFSLVDGDFSLVVYDSRSKAVYLVVDKLGCNDIYFRKCEKSILFSSRPCDLFENAEPFDAVSVSFLLAHEGFIPSPFTLSAEVMSVGRSRFAKISMLDGKMYCRVEYYWHPQARWSLPSTTAAREKLYEVLKDSVEVRQGKRTAILLSGGVDSSLILNLANPRPGKSALVLTGSVKGWQQGEEEIAHSRSIAQMFGLPHEAVVLDPQDDSLPDESVHCSASWMSGVRLILPLWRRFALHLRERLGDGYNVLAGQTADTLADNNYTSPTPGYLLRRIFFSSWFLRFLPPLRAISPSADSFLGRIAVGCSRSLAGDKITGILASILAGLPTRDLFYLGRVFGHSEMPGVSKAYFPMLTTWGFDRVVNWYSSQFVKPVVESLDAENFYGQMIQLSMDMNMLHLDSRLLFHTYREEGGRAQLPFMDARFVTLFGSLPYSARACYRKPKHVIYCQLERKEMKYAPKPRRKLSSAPAQSPEQLLLEGTIGAYYRDLLHHATFPDRSPTLFSCLSEQYFERQTKAFRNGDANFDHRFIAKLGSLEVWSRFLVERSLRNATMDLPMAGVSAK